MDLDKAKRQIRALLNLGTDDGATDAEAENALRFARRLMLRHQLSEEDLAAPQRDPHAIAADTEYGSADHWTQGAKLSSWETSLGWAICRLVGTVKWYTRGQGTAKTAHGTLLFDEEGQPRKATRLCFYGPMEDAQDATALFAEWSTLIAAMARMRYGGAFRGAGRSYCEGFASALIVKAKTIEREEARILEQHKAGELQAAESSSALVLAQQTSIMAAKLERCTPWLEGQGVRLGWSIRGGNRQDGDAYRSGQSDGQRASFNRGQRGIRRLGQ